jgi:hypothetical protein
MFGQIIREVGLSAYNKATALMYGPDSKRFRSLQDRIQDQFVGPDCYWKNPAEQQKLGCSVFFGNAWWIPFPPTLVRFFESVSGMSVISILIKVIRYDDGPLKVLQDVSDFELYIAQNTDREIQKKRQIRLALRALDGQKVAWPYNHVQVSREVLP